MIDERNINNIIELIESSNQKIKTIKEAIEEQKSTFELPKSDFKNLASYVEDVLKSKKFDNLQELFNSLNKNISFKTDFLKEQYTTLDENIFKVQNIAKHIEKDISEDVGILVDIVETFSYKIKILQGIVSDINNKITSFSGENAEKFLKDFRSDCGDFDEEFEQVLRELKQNFRKASDITAKLSKLDTGVDLSKELFSINVSINAIMSTLSVFDEKYKDLGKAFAESGLYSDFTAKLEDLSYNTKHLIRNIDNFNKIIEEGSSVKEQVVSLEQRIDTINGLIQTMNQEGLLEIKALLTSIDNTEDVNEIKNSLNNLNFVELNEKLNVIKEELTTGLSVFNQDGKFDEFKAEIKESINALNQDEKLNELKETLLAAQSGNEAIEEIKNAVAGLENVKNFGQSDFALNEIQQNIRISHEKLDELMKVSSMVSFGEVEKEISFLSNDLEIVSEEIKHSRSIAEKSFSKLENIFESFNLTELKNRIFEFENYLKKFLKKEDLQLFANDIQAITEKFELANGVIIEGFDDIESLKNYILGFEEKFTDLTNAIKTILAENQEKFDSAIEAFDNTYKIDEIINSTNEIMSQLNDSKGNILNVLNEGQEKLELLIKTMDSSDKFDEIQENIRAGFENIQSESSAGIQQLSDISKVVESDIESLKASVYNIINENQEKFENILSNLDERINSQQIQDKLNFVIQTIENQSENNEIQSVSNKLSDEINSGKYLVIDAIRESQIKLEEFVASVDNAHRIEELKNVTGNLHEEIFKTKEIVLNSLRDHQDRVELLVKAIDDSDKIDEVNEISKNLYSELMASKEAVISAIKDSQSHIEEAVKLTDVSLKINQLETLSGNMIDEIRLAKDVIQNITNSINPQVLGDLSRVINELKDSINETQDSVLSVGAKIVETADKTDVSMLADLVKDRYEQLEYLIRAYDTTADISAIKENIENISYGEDFDEIIGKLDSNRDIVDELRSVLEERTRDLELVMKSVENTDDINELRNILFSIENEQKELKNTMDFVAKQAESPEVSDEINALKEVLFSIENEQRTLKNSIEAIVGTADNTDDINYLKGILIDMEQEQRDIKSSVDAVAKESDIYSLKDNLSELVSKDDIHGLYDKVESAKDTVYELRSVLEERTRELELVMKSVESTDDINDLRDILFKIEDEQKNIKDSLEEAIKSGGNIDDINYLKDILVDMEQEQKEIKSALESVGKNPDFSSDINEIRNILFTIENEQKELKQAINSLTPVDNTDDINYLKGILVDMEQEQRDIKSALDSVAKESDLYAITEKLSDISAVDGVYEVGQKVDITKDAISELKSTLEERTQNLEFLMKSIENTDDISELKNILFSIENEQKELKNTMDFVAKQVGNSEASDEINSLKEILFSIENEQKTLKNSIEAIVGTADNTDDINYLKGILVDMEQEQKDIKSSLDYMAKVSENSEISSDISEIKDKLYGFDTKDDLAEIKQKLEQNKDIVYELRIVLEERTRNLELLVKSIENTEDITDLKDVLFNVDNEQKEIKEIIEAALKSADNSEDFSYLKNLLSEIDYEQKTIKAVLEKYLPANEDVKNSLGNLENKIDTVYEIKDELLGLGHKIAGIESEFANVLHQEDVSSAFNTVYEIKNDIANLYNGLSALKNELQAVSSDKNLEEAVEQLENLQYIIKEKTEETASITSGLNSVESKIDELKNSSDLNYELKMILGNIQEDQLTLKALVSSMDDDETVNALKEQIQAAEYTIKNAVEANRAKEDIEQLKLQIEHLTQQIVVQVMQVFDNISFEQETQEIKDFVDESYSGVKNVLNVLKSNIERLLDAPKPIYIEELRQEIEKIAQNLDSVGPEMSEYVNTITSLRLSLEELAKTKESVNILEQNISNVSIEVDEILRISRDISSQFDIIYTHNEAKEDFAKIKSALDNIIDKQHEQSENVQKEDLKGGIDNVNLSINYINENLNEFLGEYRIFQDKLSETMHNLEGMSSAFMQTEAINSEYKKGVSETFKSLKKDFSGVITTVGTLYNDISKVTALTSEMLDVSSKDKAEILQGMQGLKEIIENSDIDKLKDNFSTIIFSINGFMNNVDEKFVSIIEDTKGAYNFTAENNEIVTNLKSSVINIIEWTNSANREFARIQSGIESFRDIFEESAEDIKQIIEIKAIVSDLDSALASRVEEVFDRQIQSKLDNQILPEFELLDKKIEKKLVQKLAPLVESKDQDKEDLRFIINNQLSEETASLKELIDVVERNIIGKIQNGFERVFAQELDFSSIVEKLDSEFASVNDKLEDSLSKVDVSLYQSNVRLDEGLSDIRNEVSSLNVNIDDSFDKIGKAVKNINFAEVNYKIDQGISELNQKIDETNLPQIVTKVEDEFSAMNKKLDIDFFDLNKRVVDEFNIIEEKLDSRTDSLLQNIEESNSQLASEVGKFAGKIEHKTEQMLGNIDSRLDSQKEVLLKNVESINGKLVSEMEQIGNLISSQTQQAVENLGNVKNEMSQEFVELVDKLDGKNQTLLKNIEESKDEVRRVLVEFDSQIESIVSVLNSNGQKISEKLENTQKNIDNSLEKNSNELIINVENSLEVVSNKLNSQPVILKNVEEAKDEIKKLTLRLDQNLDFVMQNLNSATDNFDKKIGSSESNIQGSLEGIKNEILQDVDSSLEKIIEKLDGQSEILKHVEESRSQIRQILSKLDEHSSDVSSMLNSSRENIESSLGNIKHEIAESVETSIEKISNKLNSQSVILKNVEKSKAEIGQILSKLDDYSDVVQNYLSESRENTSQKLDESQGFIERSLTSAKHEIVQNLDNYLNKIANKLNLQPEILKNIEEAKEVVSKLAEQADTKSDDEVELVLNNLEQVKESMLYLSKNLDNSQNYIEKISENIENLPKNLTENVSSLGKNLSNELKSVAGKNVNTILDNMGQSKDEIKLEFVQIVEKIDAQSEKIESLEVAKEQIFDISNGIAEAKSGLDVINGKLDAQTGLVIKNVEDSNAKLDKTLSQVTSKLDNQSKTVLKNLEENQKNIQQSISEITGKIDTQTEIVFNNLGESKVELDDISKKISAQSESILKNVEETKEELEQELVQIIDKIDLQTEQLSKTQDKKLKSFEEKLKEQENKMQAIDEKLDILIERLNTVQALDLGEIVIALEKRMGSLDENIKKIVSFVDEE